MKNFGAKTWFALTAVFAFASVISFFQINSYWADRHRFNGFLGWLGVGIVAGIIAVYCLVKTAINSNGGNDNTTT